MQGDSAPAFREVISSYADVPSASNSLYQHRSVYTGADGVETHLLSGVHLLFEAGHSNGLHTAFHVPRDQKLDAANPDVATKALRIACDTLEIRGELSLPECNIKIHARRVLFREGGSINTTPLDWAMERAADFDLKKKKGGANGAKGRNAGSFELFIGTIDTADGETVTRFVGRGGGGQAAGIGRNGENGTNMASISASYRHGEHKPWAPWQVQWNTFSARYASPCVFAKYHWHWIVVLESGQRGVNAWPTSGEDALPPGVPGSGGDGAGVTSNLESVPEFVDNTAGEAGAQAPDVTGGRAGTPSPATHYDLTIRFDLASSTAGGDNTLLEKRETHAGKSYSSKPAAEGAGSSPAPTVIECANAWIDPLQLESVLRYARDALLAGAREEIGALLLPYADALAQPMPLALGDNAVWSTTEAARWNAAQSEIATMRHRLHLQLDYFGNPAGYMPLLSLQATLRLYDLDTKDAVRTLLLTAWVQEKANATQSAANALGSAIEETNKDTQRVADELVKAERRMTSLDQELTSLESRLAGLGNDLGLLRTRLYNQAADDINKKALIKAGIKMAGAICQVVPVGQPVLGTVGSLAGIVADIDDEGAPDTLSKMGDTISKAREAANKATSVRGKAKKAKAGEDEESAQDESSAWAAVGDGLGPALSLAGEAIGALQVSESEIEIELAKLAAADPAWHALVARIRSLNKDKGRIFHQLSQVLQAIGDGYARLANNADTVVTFQRERNQALGKLSPEANQMVARMGQAARLSLQRTLYLLVKSYETTVFKPLAVDWGLDQVFDKIHELLKPGEGFDASTILAHAEVVAPLFDENKRRINRSLQDDYRFADMKQVALEFGFTDQQTPEQLDRLQRGKRLTVNPLNYGLILPNQQGAKAIGFSCTKFEFDPEGPAMPPSGNAIITLRTGGDGTVRSGANLFAVRSDAPRVWSWTYHFSNRKVEQSEPSLSSLDLLNALLESDDNSIKLKLAAPPAWSDLTLQLSFSPALAEEEKPVLKTLLFNCRIESAPAPLSERVLDVRTASAAEQIDISPADLGGRGAGQGGAYRIYNTGVRVSLDAQAGEFARWEILNGSRTGGDDPHIELTLDTNTLAYSRHVPEATSGSKILEYVEARDQDTLTREIGDSTQLAAALKTGGRKAGIPMTAAPSFEGQAIRAAGSKDAPVIAVVEPEHDATILHEADGWAKVIYRGLVGYLPSN